MPGARAHFKINPRRNPNPGGGCLCSPDAKIVGCDAPFAVGTHKEQFVSKNPFTVIGAGCMLEMAKRAGFESADDVKPAEPAPVSAPDVKRALEAATLPELLEAINREVGVSQGGK